MITPPPSPQDDVPVAHKAIKRAVFMEKLSLRLGDVSFDYSLIEKSHQKAEAWINQNPGIAIV